jgi:hypothetical protein
LNHRLKKEILTKYVWIIIKKNWNLLKS